MSSIKLPSTVQPDLYGTYSLKWAVNKSWKYKLLSVDNAGNCIVRSKQSGKEFQCKTVDLI
jgi:hypothetical protein